MILNFNPFPVLTTDRLTLRQLNIADANDIHQLRSDPEINKMVGRETSKGIEDAQVFIEKITQMVSKNDGMYWAIELRDTQTFAGTICIYNFNTDDNSVEIGYELLPAYYGKGLASEAIVTVINYAFNTLGAKVITATPAEINMASIKLLEKLNFKFVDSFTAGPDNEVLLNYNLEKINS